MPIITLHDTARQCAAMHRTELLLARCRDCPSPCDAAANAAAGAQSLWHATRQEHFLAWLDAGGFAQTEEATGVCTIENSGIAPLFSAPERDSLGGIEILSTPHQRCG